MQHFIWNMDPIFISMGPIKIHWYGLFFAIAFLTGFKIMESMFKKEGKSLEELDSLLIYMVLGTIIGARLGHVLFYQPDLYLSHPLEIFAIWNGGLASHGGAIGIALALYLYSRQHPHFSYLWLLDRMTIPAMLGGAFIRIGNFFNSEIIGVPSNVPWSVIFLRIDNLPRHPTQLYESLTYLIIFAILFTTYRIKFKNLPNGMLAGLFLTFVFIARFCLEFTKIRQADYALSMPLNIGQFLSIPAVIIGGCLLWSALTRKNKR